MRTILYIAIGLALYWAFVLLIAKVLGAGSREDERRWKRHHEQEVWAHGWGDDGDDEAT